MSVDCDISEGVIFIGKDCESLRFIERLKVIDEHFCNLNNNINFKGASIYRMCPEPGEEEEPGDEIVENPCVGLGCQERPDTRTRAYWLDVTSIKEEHIAAVEEIEQVICEALLELGKINVNICRDGLTPPPPEPGEEEEGGGEEEEEEGGGGEEEEEPPPPPCLLPYSITIETDCELFEEPSIDLAKIPYLIDPLLYHTEAYQWVGLTMTILVRYDLTLEKWQILIDGSVIAQSQIVVTLCQYNFGYQFFDAACLSSDFLISETPESEESPSILPDYLTLTTDCLTFAETEITLAKISYEAPIDPHLYNSEGYFWHGSQTIFLRYNVSTEKWEVYLIDSIALIDEVVSQSTAIVTLADFTLPYEFISGYCPASTIQVTLFTP